MFLDADTLLLQNSDELFERDEFSAAPDAGWPDCFNSGVFVFRPNLNTFKVIQRKINIKCEAIEFPNINLVVYFRTS